LSSPPEEELDSDGFVDLDEYSNGHVFMFSRFMGYFGRLFVLLDLRELQ
jgi:hypothetical protein